MNVRDFASLCFLAAIWGASFLFLRLAAPEFGAFPMAFLRMGIASLLLLPLLLAQNTLSACRGRWRHLLLIGFLNFALPFTLWAFAMQSLPAGVASILNATSPLWGGLVAWLWLKDQPNLQRGLGLVLGFIGVAVLTAGKSGFGGGGGGLAILASLMATLAYGISANYTKQYLTGMPALAVAGGSQLCAVLFLLPFAIWQWPAHAVSAQAWWSALALGVACTGIANVIYFRLIARIGPARAISTTFLIPAFGMLWGVLFLAEHITALMLAGCLVILAGTALATGAWRLLLGNARPSA